MHSYDLYHIHFTSFSSYNRYRLNLHQSVEHRTGITEVMGSNPVGASELFLGFICNCLSCFITARMTFTCILYPQFTHMIFITYTHHVIASTVEKRNLTNLSANFIIVQVQCRSSWIHRWSLQLINKMLSHTFSKFQILIAS